MEKKITIRLATLCNDNPLTGFVDQLHLLILRTISTETIFVFCRGIAVIGATVLANIIFTEKI